MAEQLRFDFGPELLTAYKPGCAVSGCGAKRHAKGYCAVHYARIMRRGHPDIDPAVSAQREAGNQGKKRCPSCGIARGIAEFGKSGSRADGLNWRCRQCSAAAYAKLDRKEPLVEGSKNCCKCGIEKRVREFGARRSARDGRDAACKVCRNAPYHQNGQVPLEATKRCSKCGQQKSNSEFLSRPRNKSGLDSWCRSCRSKSTGVQALKNERAAIKDGMKHCAKCDSVKLIEEFHKNRSRLVGHSSYCKDCARKVQEVGKVKYGAQKKRYYQTHRHQVLVRVHHYRSANLDLVRVRNQQYHQRNRDKRRLIAYRRRSRRLINGGAFNERDSKRLFLRWNGKCAYCRDRVADTLDHVIPLARGGTSFIGNLLPACRRCNASKNDRTIMEWRMTRIRLNRNLGGSISEPIRNVPPDASQGPKPTSVRRGPGAIQSPVAIS